MAKEVVISDYSAAVTLLSMYKDDCKLGTATGFFYLSGDEGNETVFLVTNKHCVIDKTKEFYPNKLSLVLHTDSKNVKQNTVKTIALYEEGKPIWLEHSRAGIDLAVIKIKKELINDCFYKGFSKNNFPPDDLILEVGEDLLVLGYPLGFYDKVHNLPIARKGSISSSYGVDFEGEPHFLVDSNLHPGTSGSPVITKPSMVEKRKTGTHMGKWTFYIVGINSGAYGSLGLNKIWYIELLEEIIKGKK